MFVIKTIIVEENYGAKSPLVVKNNGESWIVEEGISIMSLTF